MSNLKPNTNRLFLTNIEKLIINDETMMRLLVYAPEDWNEELQKEIFDPLDERLPNIVDDSKKYWELVEDKVRKGSKRMRIESTKSAVLYIAEGRERPIFGNNYLNKKEVAFRIVVNEDFEVDDRISRISDRLSHLLMRESEVAGYGKIDIVGKNPREAPLGNRLQEDIYSYIVLSKSGG